MRFQAQAVKRFAAIFTGVLLATQADAGLLLQDSFTQDSAESVAPAGWTGPMADDDITAGSLTAPAGLLGSVGNKFTLNNDSDDYSIGFTPQTTGGQFVYYSFLVQIDDLGSLKSTSVFSGLIMLADGTNSSDGVAAVSFKADADNPNAFNIGFGSRANIGAGEADAVGDNTEYGIGETVFIVASTQVSGGGSTPISRIWINPDASTFGGPEPVASFTSNVGHFENPIDNLIINGQSAPNVPGLWSIDEIRVGTSFAEVTPVIPEPGSFLLVAAGALLIGFRRR
ncbi:MAG: PEP-CTERM sorting domain-containing protein [Planctomycetota bacterium]